MSAPNTCSFLAPRASRGADLGFTCGVTWVESQPAAMLPGRRDGPLFSEAVWGRRPRTDASPPRRPPATAPLPLLMTSSESF